VHTAAESDSLDSLLAPSVTHTDGLSTTVRPACILENVAAVNGSSQLIAFLTTGAFFISGASTVVLLEASQVLPTANSSLFVASTDHFRKLVRYCLSAAQ
jgi:hypothetical protein